MTEPDLTLLFEGGDKSKPLSPLVLNAQGEKGGRLLGHNSTKDISEWAVMVYLCEGKNKMLGKNCNNRSRTYPCDDPNCESMLKISTLFDSFPVAINAHRFIR